MTDEDQTDSIKKEADFIRIWLNNISDAQQREKDYRKEGRKIIDLYEAKTPSRQPFAILYSNTETLVPAVYNQVPIPVVTKRYKDEDPVSKAAAEVGTRIDKFLVDMPESDKYDTFDELMQDAVLNAALVNRGVTRFRYDADTSTGQVKNECVYGDAVRWDKFCHGYARTWKKVPWICFEWDMTRTECKDLFGEEIAKKMSFDTTALEPEEGSNTGESRNELYGVNLAKIYEVWDKRRKKVFFLSPNLPDQRLKELDDPLQLAAFFPLPKPMNFTRKVTTLVPTPLYIQYESQAKELNDLTRRLKHVINAIKVRGFYNNTIEGMEKVLQADENTLIGVENMASMPEGMGLDKMIWLMPIADLVTVAQSLYQQRESAKQVIYEITGISDILRGVSSASETARAQDIKNQWGSLRLKKMQKEVMRYCRDSLRIMLEIAVTKFGPETAKAMTGLDLPMAAQKQQAQMQIQMITQQAQQQAAQAQQIAMMQAQATGQPPEPAPPPQPPQIPPELQAVASKPSWEEILGVLRDDTLRNYKVDIETNSTIDAEAAQDKQDIAELMNAMAQWMNGMMPLIEKGIMPIEVAKGMLLTICRRYTFGSQIEDAINEMKAPEPQADPAAEAKLAEIQANSKADAEKHQMEMQKMQLDLQMQQEEMKLKQAEMQGKMQLMQAELQVKQAELAMQGQALQLKTEGMVAQHQIKMQGMTEKAEFDRQQREQKAVEKPETTDAAV